MRRTLLIAVLVLIVAPTALLAWLLGTESGARTALPAAARLSGGMLSIEGVHGRLVGPLRVERIALEQPQRRIVLGDVHLDWRPIALLQGKLHLLSLQAAELNIINSVDRKDEPAMLPDDIRLPFALQADQVRLAHGAVNRGPLRLFGFGPLAFGLDYDASRYRLRLREFAAASSQDEVSTRLSGEATLAAAKPYALEGRFTSRADAQIEQQAIGATGEISLTGTLAELRASLDFMSGQSHLKGDAVLRPFSQQMMGPARLDARALDLAAFDRSWPRTALDIDLHADDDGSGELKMSNAAAGAYDRQLLPLPALKLRFLQSADQVHLDRIVLQAGSAKRPAGEISGSGRYADGALSLKLQTGALDLQRIDTRLRATRLAGQIELRHAAGRQEFSVALNEPARRELKRLALDAHGQLEGAALTLRRSRLQAGSGSIDATAHIDLSDRQSFSAQGKFNGFRLQELGAFSGLPQLLLNGEFSVRGARQPRLEADLAFAISDSRLAGQELHGNGEAQLRGERLRVPRFELVSGANRLHIQGELSQGDAQQKSQLESRLAFRLDAPLLAQLGPRFGGFIHAHGLVHGSLARARIEADWTAGDARLPGGLRIDAMQGKAVLAVDRGRPFFVDSAVADVSARGLRLGDDELASLSAQLRFAPQPDAPLALALRAEGISTGRLRAKHLTATAQGSTARHVLDLALQESGQDWALRAAGGLHDLPGDAHWQGRIEGFDARGALRAHLPSPAALHLSRQRVQLDDFLLDIEGGRIAVERFSRDAAGVVTRGRIERLQLAQLLRHMAGAPSMKTDLQLAGAWDLRLADTLSGSFSMRRESGDVTLFAGGAPLALGLRTLQAGVHAEGGRLALQLRAEGVQLGRIDVDAGTLAGSGPARLSVASDAPLAGSARVDVPSLRWIAPLISPALLADGRLHSKVVLAGTFGAPRLAGSINGEALRLAWSGLGLDLRDGVLQSHFNGNQLLIRQLAFQGAEGKVSLSGPVDLGGGSVTARLGLAAERFALLNRADRKLVVSGNSELAMRGRQASIQGAFTVDSGFFDLGSAGKPELADDVVIVGQKEKQPAQAAADIDISVALGDGVRLQGRGLNAVLTGKGRIVSAAGESLRAQGTLSVVRGTYTAYGRELAIEQGLLRFSGPLGNPALDILAMRRGQEVEAGVSVRGTVLQPRVTLVSEPVVPDTEKLSWLVLGRGLASAGAADMGALQAAAAALLSEGAAAGVQSRIAGTFGLDTVSVGTSQDSLRQRIVTLGKQISSKLYLSYQQGLESAGSVLQLRYTLSPKLSLEAEAGTRSALSLFYNIAFD